MLRKANTLKGSSLSVTEDMSRRVREARTELRKFMRDLKKTNPAATCHLQYDKLFVNHRCYVWSEAQAKVVEFSQADQSRPSSRSSSPVKPSRHTGNNGNISRANSRSDLTRTSSCVTSCSSLSLDTWDNNDGEDDKDRKIRELEETLRKQKELMEILQRKLDDNQVVDINV